MEDYQKRVVKEKDALDRKLKSLLKFITGEHFYGVNSIQQYLLEDQFDHMLSYSRVLRDRISNFNKKQNDINNNKLEKCYGEDGCKTMKEV